LTPVPPPKAIVAIGLSGRYSIPASQFGDDVLERLFDLAMSEECDSSLSIMVDDQGRYCGWNWHPSYNKLAPWTYLVHGTIDESSCNGVTKADAIRNGLACVSMRVDAIESAEEYQRRIDPLNSGLTNER